MIKEWDIRKIYKELEEIYKKKDETDEEWSQEKDPLVDQLHALEQQLSSFYEVIKAEARGGSGIILKVKTKALYDQVRILKFPRPLKENAQEFSGLLEKEIKLLSTIKCRNIVSVHEAGNAKLAAGKEIAGLNYVPYYIMDFIDGEDSDKYLENNRLRQEELLLIIEESLDAIAHLHKKNLVHVDIKPANIRIDRDKHPILLDLGTTKERGESEELTKIGCTIKYACRNLAQRLSEKRDESRAEGYVKRNEINPIWDLHCFSLTIREWMDVFQRNIADDLSLYLKKYILLFWIRLFQDDYSEQFEKDHGVPLYMLGKIRYRDIFNAKDDFAKIYPGIAIGDKIPELNVFNFKTIQIASGDSTPFTDRVNKTLEHPFLRRLSEISQLGIVKLIYPTATHTRLEHSLGTYHNAIKLINTLYNDPLNPVFRQLLDLKHYRATLLAALIHDIGHFPLAHDLEEIDDRLFSHKNLTTALIKGERDEKKKGSKKMEFPPMIEIFRDWEVEEDDVLSILQAKLIDVDGDIISRILKSIISGPLDADKMDYLLRDSTRLKVPYPDGIDMDRLLRCLTLVIKAHANGVFIYVGIHEKGIVPAEFVILARYAMYSQVYWHHTVRAVKAMLHRAVAAIIDSFEDDEFEKNKFKSEFEQFVLYRNKFEMKKVRKELFPEVLSAAGAKPELQCTEASFKDGLEGAALSEQDRSVLKFIGDYLLFKDIPETETIDDILNRRLFKRAYVFDWFNNETLWRAFAKNWDSKNARERRNIECQLDQVILKKILEKVKGKEKDKNDTVYLDESYVSRLEAHVKAKKPLILIDFPSEKPGSSATLKFIKEQDRRELRKSKRICGEVCESSIWHEFAVDLRKKAGRIRVFIHPEHIETVMAVVKSHWISEQLSDLETLCK